jgi:hypothetical protein
LSRAGLEADFEDAPASDDLLEVTKTEWGAAVTLWDVLEVVTLPGILFRGRGDLTAHGHFWGAEAVSEAPASSRGLWRS